MFLHKWSWDQIIKELIKNVDGILFRFSCASGRTTCASSFHFHPQATAAVALAGLFLDLEQAAHIPGRLRMRCFYELHTTMHGRGLVCQWEAVEILTSVKLETAINSSWLQYFCGTLLSSQSAGHQSVQTKIFW